MAVKVEIPHLLRELTRGQGEVFAPPWAGTVAQVLDELEKKFPGVREKICAEDGSLRQFVNLYVNEEEVRFLQGLSTELKQGDIVTILPMIAGG